MTLIKKATGTEIIGNQFYANLVGDDCSFHFKDAPIITSALLDCNKIAFIVSDTNVVCVDSRETTMLYLDSTAPPPPQRANAYWRMPLVNIWRYLVVCAGMKHPLVPHKRWSGVTDVSRCPQQQCPNDDVVLTCCFVDMFAHSLPFPVSHDIATAYRFWMAWCILLGEIPTIHHRSWAA